MCSALLDESGLKPSLATTRAEASLRVDATLLGQGERGEHGCWDRVSATFLGRGGTWEHGCCVPRLSW